MAFARLTSLLHNLLHKQREERELDEEVRAHQQLLEDEKIRAGMDPQEARRQARLELGGVEQVKEQVREMRAGHFLETLWQDLRFGTRMLRKNPGFTTTAVLTLALGIGATTAIFSVVDSVLLHPLPYPQPDRIIAVWQKIPNENRVPFSAPEFLEWAKMTRVFESLAAVTGSGFTMTGRGDPEMFLGQRATPSLFSVLGAQAMLGRTLSSEDARPGHDHVVVLSNGLWKDKFNGDPQVVGQSIVLDSEPYTVLGIMGSDFVPTAERYRLWVPADLTTGIFQKFPDAHFLSVFGRLAPGITKARLNAELSLVASRIHELDRNNDRQLVHAPLQEVQVGEIRRPLLLLLGAVGIVLLIVCANIANLLLSRTVSRNQEIAVRLALGAGRRRIMRQLLVESVLVSSLGGIAGVVLAAWGLQILLRLAPGDTPGVRSAQLDLRVLGFTVLVSFLTALVVGLAPAYAGWTEDWNETLRHGRRGTSGHQAGRLRSVLLFAEIALSFVLLTSAGLTLRSFAMLQTVDPGFKSASVLIAGVALPENRYPGAAQMRAFSRNVIERLRGLPGVHSAALDTSLPFTGEGWGNTVEIEGHPAPPGNSDVVQVECISPSYFGAMNIRLESGRDFDDRDSESGAPVAIVDSEMASRFWPGESALGKRINLDGPWRTVIGIVRPVKKTGLDSIEEPQLYVPYEQLAPKAAQFVARGMFLVVRSTVGESSLARSVRHAVASIDSQLALTDVGMMEQLLYESVAEPRFRTVLLGIFSAIALVLACVGVYGVVSYGVTQRVHEIGIHVALGAQPRDIFQLIVGEAVLLGASGIAVGLLGSLAVARLFSALLFKVTPHDPIALASAIVLLLSVVLGASYFPARRAMRVDPMVALRYE